MKRVTGIGGVFFKTDDPKALMAWYRKHLGIETDDYGFMFRWKEPGGYTVWSPFSKDTGYFAPSQQPFMINFRVFDLVALLDALRSEGVKIVGDMVVEENGKFAWILDPNGTKIELWEPVDPSADPYLQDT